jgi:hypothetical protein
MESDKARARAARTARLRAAADKEAAEEANRQLHATLGDALTAALLRYLAGAAPASTARLERVLALVGYSDELKKLIVRCIETNPAMEEAFLKIAELAYSDGQDAAEYGMREREWEQYDGLNPE